MPTPSSVNETTAHAFTHAQLAEVWAAYPAGWLACHCGLPTMDGHLTCGRVDCGTEAEAEIRRAAQPLVADFEGLQLAVDTICARVDALLEDRAELLAALKALRDNVEQLSGFWNESTSNFMQMADAAIAKAEGRP